MRYKITRIDDSPQEDPVTKKPSEERTPLKEGVLIYIILLLSTAAVLTFAGSIAALILKPVAVIPLLVTFNQVIKKLATIAGELMK